MAYDNTNPDDPLLVAAQPAAGRWHRAHGEFCRCANQSTFGVHDGPFFSPAELNALEAERDALQQRLEEVLASRDAFQQDVLVAQDERDALREALQEIKRLTKHDSSTFILRISTIATTALDAAQKE